VGRARTACLIDIWSRTTFLYVDDISKVLRTVMRARAMVKIDQRGYNTGVQHQQAGTRDAYQ